MARTNNPAPPARLALEDGSVFRGRAFGSCAEAVSRTGEVVFNTAMTGYQEALTDPSYAGQILTMTAPMIGNYGVAEEDVESAKPQVAGFVVRELARSPSNWRAVTDLSTWLARHGVPGIEGIDTRALVRRLRTDGAMRGVISCEESRSDQELIEFARSSPHMAGRNLVTSVSPAAPSEWQEDLGEWRPDLQKSPRHEGAKAGGEKTLHVVALDCGGKRNIYRHLVERGCEVRVVPHTTSADEIRRMKFDGLFISNGPGDPDAVDSITKALREIAGEIPTFGICLGHQLLALAFGAKTYKLKFGHRGANQPVRNLLTGRIEITSQNHGFCVEEESLKKSGCEVTHVHLNDNTVAGFRHRAKPVFAVQYHPEASPGPHDSAYLFDCFVEMMRTGEPLSAELMERVDAAGEPSMQT